MPNKKSQILIIGALGLAAIYFFTKKDGSAGGSSSGNYSDSYSDDPVIPPPVRTTGSDVIAATTLLGREAYNSLVKYDPYNAARLAAYKRMTDRELIDSWEYVWSFMLKGKVLYRQGVPGMPNYPNYPPDGSWNMYLYDAIAAIRAKYGIF